jgi:hypothetical protein
MPESAKNDNPTRVRKRDPREVIDSKMATKICGLLALRYSQNMAAEHLGCDSSTITRTAKRDPVFKERLIEARSDASIEALRLIRHTGSQERYWRAAAWMLERRHPDEYGRRAPNTWTAEQMMKVLERVLEVFMPAVPHDMAEEVMAEFEEEFSDVAEKARMSLPEYEPPEEVDEEDVGNARSTDVVTTVAQPRPSEKATSPAAIAPSSPAPIQPPPPRQAPPRTEPVRHEPVQKGTSRRDSTTPPPGQGASAAKLPPAMAAVLSDTGRRVSCLEQFVQRGPKAATAKGRQ